MKRYIINIFKNNISVTGGIINNELINHIESRDIPGDTDKAILNIYFYSETNKEICRLETIISSSKSKTEGTIPMYGAYMRLKMQSWISSLEHKILIFIREELIEDFVCRFIRQ